MIRYIQNIDSWPEELEWIAFIGLQYHKAITCSYSKYAFKKA